MQELLPDIKEFALELTKFTSSVLRQEFLRFEKIESVFVGKLYRKRGKEAKRLVHFGMTGLAAVGIMIGPYIAQEFPGRSVNPWSIASAPEVLSASTDNSNTSTNLSPFRESV